MFRLACFLTLLSIVSISGSASSTPNKLVDFEVAIQDLIIKITKEESFAKKNSLNNELISIFYDVLTKEGAFDYPFDSLKNIGILKPSDNRFRIFTWNIPQAGGLQRYFGFIQLNTNGKFEVIPLTDNRKAFSDPHLEIGNADKWYGALYYDIIEVEYEGQKFYTLLGVDQNNMFSTKRVIEIVYINNEGKLVFGHPIFKIKDQTINRVIFEYSSRSNMVLRWAEESGMIVFDHLSPLQPNFAGDFQFYVPDFSFDGFQFANSYWEYVSDIDIRNPTREKPSLPDQPQKDFDEPGFLYRSRTQNKE